MFLRPETRYQQVLSRPKSFPSRCKHVHIKVNFQNMGYQCGLQTMLHAIPPHSKKVDDSRLKYR